MILLLLDVILVALKKVIHQSDRETIIIRMFKHLHKILYFFVST